MNFDGRSLDALADNPLNAVEVLAEYKKQQSSEQGFRFLKDPLFFTSSVFLKSRQRIMALAIVMAFVVFGKHGNSQSIGQAD